MSFHNEEQFLAAVAAALGETIALVRRRGFHLERATNDGDMRLTHSHARHHAVADDDTLDLTGYGIEWVPTSPACNVARGRWQPGAEGVTRRPDLDC